MNGVTCNRLRQRRRRLLSSSARSACTRTAVVALALLSHGCMISGGGNEHIAIAAAFTPPSPRANSLHTRILARQSRDLSMIQSKTTCIGRSHSALSLARYDNLVSGIAEISIGLALGVLWSEYAVVTTGCGPLNFSDTLERMCYQGVILSAGASLFTSIVSGGKDLTTFVCEEYYGGMLAEATVVQVRAAERLNIAAVIGAFVSLGVQIINGEQMDGLSGINVEMCRAVRGL